MRRTFVVAIAMLVVLAGLTAPAEAEPGQPFQEDEGPILIYDRPICSLVNSDAAAASILGQDGGISLEVDGTTYWVFGDTLYTPNGQGVGFAPNNYATSTDTNAYDCVQMTHVASGGVAVPLQTPLGDELSLWPSGMLQLHPNELHYYVGSVIDEPPPWYVRGIGVSKFDLNTGEATRVVDLLWDANSGFDDLVIGAGQPFELDGYVYAFLNTSTSRILLARVPRDEFELPSAYAYWDGASWSPAPADAVALWTQPSHTNGAMVRWSDHLEKWVALYNTNHYTSIRVRTADALTGPWSDEHHWIDCGYFSTVFPACYTAGWHPQYDADDGKKMIISTSTTSPYQVVLHEVRLGVPIYQWNDGAGQVRLAPESPGATFTAEGVTFYAADTPTPGFSEVHRYLKLNGEQVYSASPSALWPIDTGIAFYAPKLAKPAGANVEFDPVYQWDKAGARVYSPFLGLEALGYTRGPVLFHALCGERDADSLSDCKEQAIGTDPLNRDTDGDGFDDRPAVGMNPNALTSMDNCPLVANADQANTDGEPWLIGLAIQDHTNPSGDVLGDACDADLDNDGLTNAAEAAAGTDPLARDTDGDRWPDNTETLCTSDPLSATSKPSGPDPDFDQVPTSCEVMVGGNPTKPDTDGDRIGDLIEIRWLTRPNGSDSDGDSLSDRCETSSVNEDKTVNSLDLLMIAQRFFTGGVVMEQADITRDGSVQATDLIVAAHTFGSC